MNSSKTQILAVVSLVLCVLVFLLTIGDFLALHDIGNDYVSKEILTYLNVSLSKELPDWTATKGEWRLVELSWVTRMGFLPANAVALVCCLYALRQHRPGNFSERSKEFP
jgi:hypothetical protein